LRNGKPGGHVDAWFAADFRVFPPRLIFFMALDEP